MASKKTLINYTSRDFDSIKTDLLLYAKKNYSETYRDFEEASFGAMTLDMVAYVGDMLSYYVDYQANEMFLDSAVEQNNVIRHAKSFGYNYEGLASSVGEVDFFILAPANSTGLGPDSSYLPILSAGASITSDGGASFTLVDDVRFDYSQNEVVPARIGDSGVPTHYAIKASGQVVSGEIKTVKIQSGDHERFKKLKVSSQNIAEIISVVDSSGQEFYEVSNLSQDVIYRDVANRSSDSDNVRSVLRPFSASRRFTIERLQSGTFLQFGTGTEEELKSSSVSKVSDVALKIYGKNYTTSTTFDPSKLTSTSKMGVVPSNSTLTIKYRINNSSKSNAAVGSLKRISSKSVLFKDSTMLSSGKMSDVSTSLEVSNSERIVGSTTIPDNTEIRNRARGAYAAQDRAVTVQDLETFTYMMPAKYGSAKRCKAARSRGDRRRSTDLYLLSEDTNGKLVAPTDTLKQNIKMWISQKKMMNDTIYLKDGKILNYAVDFSISADPSKNKHEVLNSAISALKKGLEEPLYMGEPLYLTDIYGILNKVVGVVDTRNVNISIKSGLGYSATAVDIRKLLSVDGMTVEVPENVALEMKYPSSDINGSVT